MFSDKLKGYLTLDSSGVILEFYVVLNFVTRYTFGKRRLEESYKKRGPTFMIRYREVLPKNLKKSITSFFKGLILSLDDSGGPKSNSLCTLLRTVSLLGKSFQSDDGLESTLNLPSNYNPLFFTRMWSKNGLSQQGNLKMLLSTLIHF
jgi:hypothetical protein